MQGRLIAPVVLVLAATVVGFGAARALGERDMDRDSAHRAELAATQIHARVQQGAAVVESLRRFLVGAQPGGVTNAQFANVDSHGLGATGLPAAAWVERVPASQRAAYERRVARIVAPDRRGRLVPARPRPFYLPATLATGVAPMVRQGIDLASEPAVVRALQRPRALYRVTATSQVTLPDGAVGLFLVQSAQRISPAGAVEPGFVVLFVPDAWLLTAASQPPPYGSRVALRIGGAPIAQPLPSARAESGFAEAGQSFEVFVPRASLRGTAVVLPWIVTAAGLSLGALAAALAASTARRARAQRELDRIFALSPDVIGTAGFDGYFRRVNPAVRTILGFTEEEFTARPYAELVHPDDRGRTEAKNRALLAGRTLTSFENRYRAKDGSYRWLQWTTTPDPGEGVVYTVARDVTERREAEAALREAREQTAALADEQAALRRVATLVAQGAPPESLFALVAEEVSRVVGVPDVSVVRFEDDRAATELAWFSATGYRRLAGRTSWSLDGTNVLTELQRTGRPARIDDHDGRDGMVAEALREAGIRSTVGAPILVAGRLWGAMVALSSEPAGLPEGAESRLAAFTELVATALANAESRSALGRLADEQTALRRLATLVAHRASPEAVFAAAAQEAGRLLGSDGTALLRCDADGARLIASDVAYPPSVPVGSAFAVDDSDFLRSVIRDVRPARVDAVDGAPGLAGALARRWGVACVVAAPLCVESRVWGVMVVSSRHGPLDSSIEQRLVDFTDLLATAIGNTESRAALARLAEEQAALRRVATLVAEGAAPADVLSAVAEEVDQLLGFDMTFLHRFDTAGMVTLVACRGVDARVAAAERWEPRPGSLLARVLHTGHSARIDDEHAASGLAGPSDELHVRSAVASPVLVEGRRWGAIGVASTHGPLPADTEQRIADFTGLVATAIANAESRAQLTASRARIVAAADDTRRRIERNLHDGAQQQLVALALGLRALQEQVPPDLADLRASVSRLARGLTAVLDDLREMSRGIHPAILAEGGLGPALRTLARRSAIPVEIEVQVPARLSEPVEVAAYYVVSEALTNAAKHAQASAGWVSVAERGGALYLSVRDDGRGGADPSKGSGLIGLRDRVDALGGTIELQSEPGEGTTILVKLPANGDALAAGTTTAPSAAGGPAPGQTSPRP